MNEDVCSDAKQWLKNSISRLENAAFLEAHVTDECEHGKVLKLAGVLRFLERVSDEFCSELYAQRLTLALVFELSSREGDEEIVEREIHGSGEDSCIKNIDAFTPPSLYLLRNPADVIFFRASKLTSIIENDGWYGFTRVSEENGDHSMTYIVLKCFVGGA